MGLSTDVCLDGRCESFLSVNVQPQVTRFNFEAWEIGDDKSDRKGFSSLGLSSSVGVVGAVSRKVKLIAEFRHLFAAPFESMSDNASTFTINYAVRIHGSEFAADIGFLRPVLAMIGSEPYSLEKAMKYLPAGYPWLSFTYQW